MATSVITVPFAVVHIGVVGYGAWESLVALTGFATVPQVPLAGAILWRAAAGHGAGDKQALRRSLTVGVVLALTSLAVFLPVLILLRRQLCIRLNIPDDILPSALLAAPVVATVLLGQGVVEAHAALLDAHQRMLPSSVARAVGQVCQCAASVSCLQAGLGLSSLAIGLAMGFVVTLTGVIFAAWRVCGIRPLSFAAPTREDWGATLKFTGIGLTGQFAGILRDRTDKVVLAALASSEWVGYYGIANRLASIVLELSQFFMRPTAAAAGMAGGWRDSSSLVSLFDRATLAVAGVGGSAAVLTLGLGQTLVVLWIGSAKTGVSDLLPYLVLSTAAAVILTGPGVAVARGVGRVDVEARYLIATAILNAVLTVALVLAVGAIGTVVASAVSWSLGSVFFVWLLLRAFAFPPRSVARAFKCVAVVAVVSLSLRALTTVLPVPADRLSALWSCCWLGALGVSAYLGGLILAGAVPAPTMLRAAGLCAKLLAGGLRRAPRA